MVLLVLVVAQAIIGLFVIYHLIRQNGRMLLRLDAIEAKLGMAAPTPVRDPVPSGLPVDSAAPDFRLSRQDGGTVRLSAVSTAASLVESSAPSAKRSWAC